MYLCVTADGVQLFFYPINEKLLSFLLPFRVVNDLFHRDTVIDHCWGECHFMMICFDSRASADYE